MSLPKKILVIAALLFLVVIAVLAINTLRLEAESLAERPLPAPSTDAAAVDRLSQAIRIQTISTNSGAPADSSLAAFSAHLEKSFPRVHAALQREQVGGSLLYTWPGSDPNVPALLLAAHQDVVPIEAGSEAKWTYPPFSGAVADGFVWGRGALDDKASLMAILEAVERRLAAGFRPSRTIYLAFGHDEEIGGSGAYAMAELLQSRGARVGLALDEGFAVLDGVIGGVGRPLALVGIAQKGYVSVELSASGSGGHSAMPTSDNAAVRVARAVTRVADSPFPARIDGATGQMLDAIAPHADPVLKVALANRWLTAPLVKRQLLANPFSAAGIRTTTAPTIVQAGSKENVLPQRARAVINYRILPGDSIDKVLAHVREAVGDERISLRPLPIGHNPAAPASTHSAEYQRMREVIRATFPHAPVAPALVVVTTDGRHYEKLARSVLRFAPLTMGKDDIARIHGNDERIGISDYMRAIAFYDRLIGRS